MLDIVKGAAQKYGFGKLSDAETLALAIGNNDVGLSYKLLDAFQDLRGVAAASLHELESAGLSPDEACRISVAAEFSRRVAVRRDPEGRIRSQMDVVDLVGDMQYLKQEELRVISVDNHHNLIAIDTLYRGTSNECTISGRDIFRTALQRGATAIVVVHNHPSGDPSPSPEDIDVTQKLYEAGKNIGIQLLDHVIVAGIRHRSMKEHGLGFRN